jgi:hypothetical protein
MALGLHKMGVNLETVKDYAGAAKERAVGLTHSFGQGLHNLYTNVNAGLRSLRLPEQQQRTEQVYQPVSYDKAA